MPTSAVKFDAAAIDVRVTADQLFVVLADGRELARLWPGFHDWLKRRKHNARTGD